LRVPKNQWWHWDGRWYMWAGVARVAGGIVKGNHPRPDSNPHQNKTKAKPLNYSPVSQHTTHTSLYLVYNGRAACAQSRTLRLEPRSSQVKPHNSQPLHMCCMTDCKIGANASPNSKPVQHQGALHPVPLTCLCVWLVLGFVRNASNVRLV
jgi:hypothetical protein